MTCVGETNLSGLSSYNDDSLFGRPLCEGLGSSVITRETIYMPTDDCTTAIFDKMYAVSEKHLRMLVEEHCKTLVYSLFFVVVCCVMSRFEWNRCSCAVHSTLENACTYKVSGCVLGPKGELSGVSRFQVLDRFLTQIYLCGPQKNAAAF